MTRDQTVLELRRAVPEEVGTDKTLDLFFEGKLLENSRSIAACGLRGKVVVLAAVRKNLTASFESIPRQETFAGQGSMGTNATREVSGSVQVVPGDLAALTLARREILAIDPSMTVMKIGNFLPK